VDSQNLAYVIYTSGIDGEAQRGSHSASERERADALGTGSIFRRRTGWSAGIDVDCFDLSVFELLCR